MPEIFLPFGAFAPEGGDVGEGLVRADNAIPIHRGHRPLRQRADVATLASDGPVTGAFVHIFQAEEAGQLSLPYVQGQALPANLVGSDGGVVDLWSYVDDEEPGDDDWVVWGGAPTSIRHSWGMTAITDPGVDTGFVVRYRYKITGGAGAWSLTSDLTDGLSPFTIETVSDTGDTAGWVERSTTLDSGDVSGLTAFSSLVLGFRFTVAGSAQYGRPIADIVTNGWVTNAGATTNLYQAIDESVASDTDYAQTPSLQLGGSRSKYRVSLTSLVDPFVKDDAVGTYTVRYRYLTTNAGVNVKVTLGYDDPGGRGGTVIKSQEHTSITPLAWTAGSFEIEDEIWAIPPTAYETLWMEFEGHWPTEGTSVATETIVPTSDIEDDDWTPSSGATLYEAIDADDGVSITAEDPSPADVEPFCTVGIVANDPGLNTDHALTIKAAAASAGTANFKVELLEGSTVRFSKTFTRTSTSLTNEVITIHSSFVAAIGDYSNLRLKFYDQLGSARCKISFAKLTYPQPRKTRISWAELETPSTAQGQISLVNLEAPAVVTEYQGDKPTIYAGTPADLYEVDSSGFTEISKAGGYGSGVTGETGAAWRFCQVGNHVIATDGSSPVQWREDSTGDFKDLIATPDPDPTARFVAPWRERLLLGSIGLTGHAVDEIWVSAPDDIEDFEPSEETRAGFEPIRSRPGQIMGLVGGQEAVILKRNSIHSMLYTGGSTLFRIETISNGIGMAYPSSLIEHGDWYYFHSGEAFFRGNLETVERIGDGAVTRMLTDSENLDESIAELQPGSIAVEDQIMVGSRCPKTGLLMWTYQAKGDGAWQHSRGVLYNPLEDRWAPLSGAFDVSALTHIPNTINPDTHLLKPIIGFSWDGTDTTWFKWSGNTYEVVFDTKLRRLPSSSEAARDPITGRFADPSQEPMIQVRAVRPVFSFPRNASVTLPNVTIVVTGYRDAERTTSTNITETATVSNRNDRGIYSLGRGVQGFYHSFQVTLDEVTTNAVYNLVGLWVDYQVGGSR